MLVVDDDPEARELLRRVLERNDLAPLLADSAASGLRALYEGRPDIVLLDIELPDADGYAALERIREMTDVPVVMLSGRDDEPSKVSALRAGADDYVTKPFGLQELVARIEVLLRRALETDRAPDSYDDGLVRIDYAALEVSVAGRPLQLTALELRLLLALVERANEVVSPERLLDQVWGDASLSRERVKLYVGYLREKFRGAGVQAPIETVRGFGYRYRPPSG